MMAAVLITAGLVVAAVVLIVLSHPLETPDERRMRETMTRRRHPSGPSWRR